MTRLICWLIGHRWCRVDNDLRHGAVRYCERCYLGQVRLMFPENGGAMFTWINTGDK